MDSQYEVCLETQAAHLYETKPPWRSGYVTRLVSQGPRIDPALLQSVGRDYKLRSHLHMTLAIGKTSNQPTFI